MAGIPLTRLWLRSLRTVDRSMNTLFDPLRLVASLPQALALLSARRPRAVFTTGGYVSIPVLIAARLLRVPSLLWEGNRVPGRSVRAVARLATAIAVSFEETMAALPGRPYLTGTPIRSFSGRDRADARSRLGLEASSVPLILVFGGSQVVRRLDDAVAAALPELTARAIVLHITGEAALAAALERRAALPDDRGGRYRPHAVLHDEMTDALVAADLIVGRAGSSTIAEVTALGRPMIVVPYPHAAGHQMANAQALAEVGAATLIADEAFDGPALAAAAAILDDPERLAEMALASRAMGWPGAADANAELVLALAERRPLPSAVAVAAIARGAP